MVIDKLEKQVIPSFERELALASALNAKDAEIFGVDLEKADVKYKNLKRKRIGLSVYAGYGYSADGESPSIGIGVTYTFIRF